MRCDQQKLSSVVQHRSPGWRWRFGTQAQKTPAAFGDNRRRQAKSGLDKQRRKKIGKQMARNNAARFTTEGPSRLDKLLLSERENFAADQSGVASPADQAKRQNDVIET